VGPATVVTAPFDALTGVMMSVVAESFLAHAERPRRFSGWLPRISTLGSSGLRLPNPVSVGDEPARES
jgi:hypothetical protein